VVFAAVIILEEANEGGLYQSARPYFLGLALLCLILTLAGLLSGWRIMLGPAVIGIFVFLGLYAAGHGRLSGIAFTLWVGAAVSAAMFYPDAFRVWWGLELKVLIVPLIQIIMFGMGTQLMFTDFLRVFAMPKAVMIGIFLQFAVMPFVGKFLAMTFTSDPEIAAGMVLIGSCPGGVASNVMTYLAGGNVALSVTMTSCSTLIAPVMTPAMTKMLAGTYVEVKFVAMMISIIKMIIVPVAGGLLVNTLLGRLASTHPRMSLLSAAIMRGLPYVSMFSICFIIGIITSLSRDALLAGSFVAAIVVAVILHNFAGYLLGYWGARLFRMGEIDARTVAIEVGLQNGGMASGLAIEVLKSDLAALPPAVFGPWMNMSGAAVASWWARHVPGDRPES
jgi:BASS family bile acid:Na+ symporter